MFVNLFFIIRKNEIKYIMHDPHWGHGGQGVGMQLCAETRLETTLLISRLALRAHNLISQLTLYDTPRPTKQKCSPTASELRTKRNPKQNQTQPNSAPGLQATNCRVPLWRWQREGPRTPEPRVKNRVIKKSFQTSFPSHLQLEIAATKKKASWNQLTTHLKAANAFERYFMPLNSGFSALSVVRVTRQKINNSSSVIPLQLIPSLSPTLTRSINVPELMGYVKVSVCVSPVKTTVSFVENSLTCRRRRRSSGNTAVSKQICRR